MIGEGCIACRAVHTYRRGLIDGAIRRPERGMAFVVVLVLAEHTIAPSTVSFCEEHGADYTRAIEALSTRGLTNPFSGGSEPL